MARSNDLIYSWILDFEYHEIWKEFEKNGTVEQSADREFIQGLLKKPLKSTDDTIKTQLLLIILFFKLVDGEEYWIQYSESDKEITVLENALNVFGRILTLHPDLKTEGTKFIDKFKQQAVYVCARDSNFKSGRRILSQNKIADKQIATEVKTVLESEDNDHFFMQKEDYRAVFIPALLKFLRKIHKKFQKPFLEKAKTKMLNSSSTSTQINVSDFITDEEKQLKIGPCEFSRILRTMFHPGKKFYLEGKQKEEFMKKLEGIKQVALKKTQSTFTDSEDENLPDNDEVRITSTTSNAKKRTRRKSITSRKRPLQSPAKRANNSDNSWEVETPPSTLPVPRLPPLLPMRRDLTLTKSKSATSRSISPSTSISTREHYKVPWTEEESTKLCEGVKKFGVGQWAEIKTWGGFYNRTSVHIKDKWRTITKRMKNGRNDHR